MSGSVDPSNAVEQLKDLSVQIDELKSLLEKVAPLIALLRGTIDTLLPLLKTLGWFQDKYNQVVDYLLEGLPDTPEMREAVKEHLLDKEKYTVAMKEFIKDVRVKIKEGHPKPSSLLTSEPSEPKPLRVEHLFSQQKMFVGCAAFVGLFAVPSGRYALENKTKVQEINDPLVRSLTSDAIIVFAYSGLVGFAGKLFLNQEVLDSAKLGLKISFALVLGYESVRLANYGLEESGVKNYFPNFLRR